MTDDTPSQRQIRIAHALDNRFVLVAILLVVVAAVAGGLAYQTYTTTFTETEEQVVSNWDESNSFSQQAPVVRENPAFDEGEILTDRPMYFTSLSPELEAINRYSYSASESGQLDIETRATLVLRSVNSDGQTLWQTTESLAHEEYRNLAPGESATLGATLDIDDAVNQVEQVETGLGASVGATEIAVRFDTTVSGTVNDESVANTHQGTVIVDPSEETYSVETDDDIVETHQTTTTIENEVSPPPLRAYGPPVVMLLALVALLGLVSLRATNRLRPTPEEIAAVQQAKEREQFGDWISRGEIPVDALSGPRITIDSLEDLVDVAIDTDERVIEDPGQGAFFVLLDGRYCVFEPESDTESTDEEPEVTESESIPSDTVDGGTSQSAGD